MNHPLLTIEYDAQGIFRARPNRFLGIVDIDRPKKSKARNVLVHIHDPGRLKELLYDGNKILLRYAGSDTRKTKWDLLAAMHDGNWILTNSGFHRAISENLLGNKSNSPFGKVRSILPEQTFGDSRLDFLLEKPGRKKIWVEVKGCTLALNGKALFPDAPTSRGRKHLLSLISAKEKGFDAAVLILIFRHDAQCFSPNFDTDPKFSETFYDAIKKGVKMYPVVLKYENNTIQYLKRIPVCEIP